MATWSKKKVNASDVNNGNQFNVGDGLRNTDVNKIFESGLYTQDMVEHIGIGTVRTTEPGSSAKVSVTYNSSTGYPQLNFDLPRGATGPQGEAGSLGTISKQILRGSTNITIGSVTTEQGNFATYIIFTPSGKGCIVEPGTGFVSDSYYGGGNEIWLYNLRYSIHNQTSNGTFTWSVTEATTMCVRFEEGGTITREMSYYRSGDTYYGFQLSGLNFEI